MTEEKLTELEKLARAATPSEGARDALKETLIAKKSNEAQADPADEKETK
jgi:hypothetical protein